MESAVNNIVSVVGRYMAVDGYYSRRDEVNIRGSLDTAPLDWQDQISRELGQLGYTSRFQQDKGMAHVRVFPSTRKVPWVNIALFFVTLITVSFAPGFYQVGTKIFSDISIFLHWQKFAIPLITILLFHEFGHFLAARRRDIRVSFPYFLPAPTPIGTFGAFIKSSSPFQTRRDLLEVGAYGPIAGFVVATAVLALGFSEVIYTPFNPHLGATELYDPLIVRLVQMLFVSNPIPEGYSIMLDQNPMIFAAWVGMVVTALNLLPVGQLDGGHIIYALSPRLHYWISRLVFLGLVGVGIFWMGWWFWALMILLVIRFGHPPTMNDYEPLDRRSRWIGWAAMAIFILTFSPVPF